MSTTQQRAYFGATVKRLREERGWTRRELADRLGVGVTAVGNWEQGLRGAEEQNVVAMEAAFDKEPGTLGWILGQSPPPEIHSPEIAIEADDSIAPEQKRPLLAHLAEIRRINAEGE